MKLCLHFICSGPFVSSGFAARPLSNYVRQVVQRHPRFRGSDDEEGSAERDQHMRSQSCCLVRPLPLDPNDCAQQGGSDQTEGYARQLRRIGQPGGQSFQEGIHLTDSPTFLQIIHLILRTLPIKRLYEMRAKFRIKRHSIEEPYSPVNLAAA